jgi:hypothetical protein
MVLGNNPNELRIRVNTRHGFNVANLTLQHLTLHYIHTCLLPAYIIHAPFVDTTPDEVSHISSINPLESER